MSEVILFVAVSTENKHVAYLVYKNASVLQISVKEDTAVIAKISVSDCSVSNCQRRLTFNERSQFFVAVST